MNGLKKRGVEFVSLREGIDEPDGSPRRRTG